MTQPQTLVPADSTATDVEPLNEEATTHECRYGHKTQ
jgi:hypothetical protein